MKRILLILSVAAIFGACCNNQKPATGTDTMLEKTAISVDSFLNVAPNLLGKEVTVKGTVDHICKHGGKRVKLIGCCPSKSVHGEATEAIGAFKVELEGSEVLLTGIVAESKIDSTYVAEYEKSVLEAMEKEKPEAEMEHAKGIDHHAKLEEVKKWKEEIATNGKGYISTYYLEVTKVEEYKAPASSDGCGMHKTDSTKNEASVTTAPCCAAKEKPCGQTTEAAPCNQKK